MEYNFEKIAKRFKFDLEMGRFTKFTSKTTVFRILDSESLDLVLEILRNISYADANIVSSYKNIAAGVVIDVDESTWWYFLPSESDLFDDDDDDINYLPDYIKEYKL